MRGGGRGGGVEGSVGVLCACFGVLVLDEAGGVGGGVAKDVRRWVPEVGACKASITSGITQNRVIPRNKFSKCARQLQRMASYSCQRFSKVVYYIGNNSQE